MGSWVPKAGSCILIVSSAGSCPLAHSMEPVHEVPRIDGLRAGNPNHVVARMDVLGLAGSAQVIVGTDHTFVPVMES